MDGHTPAPKTEVAATIRRLARARRAARAMIIMERLWRAAIWPLGIIGLFVATAWLGLFEILPATGRIGLLAAFALTLLVSFAAFLRVRLPDERAVVARLEDENRLHGRPLEALADRPSSDDPLAETLWRTHLARMAHALPPLRFGLPHPDLGRRDRYQLRPLLAMALFVGYMAAGGLHWSRIVSALTGPRPLAAETARLDAWATPPAYTNRPPVMLSGDRMALPESDGRYLLPAGTLVTIRTARTVAAPEEKLAVLQSGRDVAPKAGATDLIAEYETALTSDGEIAVRPTARPDAPPLARWAFAIIPDAPPTIQLKGKPEAQATGALKLAYEVADDYGVASAEARISAPDGLSGTGKAAHPLIDPPRLSLSLPTAKGHNGAAQTMRDLTSHPWSGAKVRLTLEATDEAGQTGRSAETEFTLPQKRLTNPLARAIIEQRRMLALDAGTVGLVRDAIDALLIAPEKFIERPGHFFGLKLIDKTLASAKTDDDLRAALELMWTVARGIEDGDLTDAEKALREAQENLRKAIEQGADDKEIARLTDELRKAMDRYLSELAERVQKNPQTARQLDPNAKVLRKQDIDKMLKRIEDLARTGSRDAARQLLDQLQQMMENMQAGRPMPGKGGEDQRMSELLDKLGDVLRRQQELLDKTYKADPKSRPPQAQRGQKNGPQQPMTADQLAELLKQLEQGQGDVQQALKDLMDQMEKQGLGEGEDGKPGGGSLGKLGEAGEAMGRAGKALGRKRPGEAVGPEGQALDALRQGAQGLARELSQRQGQGNGPGQARGGDTPGEEDPLGRARGNPGPDFSDATKVPGEIDAERARKILEDIRGRLSQQTRPQQELDYLDRLLKSE